MTTRDQFYADATGDRLGPLRGGGGVEVTTTGAGPRCGALLADFGADVVKVEHPSGEMARRAPPMLPGSDPPVSFMHATVNRNKRSLALDLHRSDAQEVVRRLAARSDVFVENFRPGTLERWGLGYSQIRALRPDVVYVSISGYGQFGPDRDRVAYDPLAQAESGFLSLDGEPGGSPVKAPTFLADDLGGLHGALAALAALHHRSATGEGQHVDVALLDALLFQSNGYLTLGALGVELPRLGNEFRIAAPARVYRAQDGSVMAGVLLDRHWQTLCRAIGRPELAEAAAYATTAARLARREEVDGWLAAWIAHRPVAEVLARFRTAGLPASTDRRYADAAADPGVREREMLQPVAHGGSDPHPITGPVAKLSRTPTRVRSAAPALGAHNDEILTELGDGPDERARLGS